MGYSQCPIPEFDEQGNLIIPTFLLREMGKRDARLYHQTHFPEDVNEENVVAEIEFWDTLHAYMIVWIYGEIKDAMMDELKNIKQGNPSQLPAGNLYSADDEKIVVYISELARLGREEASRQYGDIDPGEDVFDLLQEIFPKNQECAGFLTAYWDIVRDAIRKELGRIERGEGKEMSEFPEEIQEIWDDLPESLQKELKNVG